MNITLKNLGKRFNRQWIFRGLHAELIPGKRYAVLGKNGSGKSTLLQTIAGYRLPSEGQTVFEENGKIIPGHLHYRFLSFASPYLELIEDYNIDEFLRFHTKLKPLLNRMSHSDFTGKLELANISGKPIAQYSSGMKQRLRLALAFFSDTPVLLLDEPCSNLDAQGVEWYRKLLDEYSAERLVVICSNHQEQEYFPCEIVIDMALYK